MSITGPLRGFWIKLHESILVDVDIALLSDTLWRRLIELKLLLGHDHSSGVLPSVRVIAYRLHKSEAEIVEQLNELASLGLIVISGTSYSLPYFCEEQGPDSSAERVARHREKVRNSQPCNDTETIRYTEREKELDKERTDKTDQIIKSVTSEDRDNEEDFAQFWDSYPKKVDRLKALEAWVNSEGKRPPLAEVLKAVSFYRKEVNGKESKYICSPSNWLLSERWTDEGVKTTKNPAPKKHIHSIPVEEEEPALAWLKDNFAFIEHAPVEDYNGKFADWPIDAQDGYIKQKNLKGWADPSSFTE